MMQVRHLEVAGGEAAPTNAVEDVIEFAGTIEEELADVIGLREAFVELALAHVTDPAARRRLGAMGRLLDKHGKSVNQSFTLMIARLERVSNR